MFETKLLNEELDIGFHNVQWSGIDKGNNAVATGIYLISIVAKSGCPVLGQTHVNSGIEISIS